VPPPNLRLSTSRRVFLKPIQSLTAHAGLTSQCVTRPQLESVGSIWQRLGGSSKRLILTRLVVHSPPWPNRTFSNEQRAQRTATIWTLQASTLPSYRPMGSNLPFFATRPWSVPSSERPWIPEARLPKPRMLVAHFRRSSKSHPPSSAPSARDDKHAVFFLTKPGGLFRAFQLITHYT
jgi:hypothetical protein